MRRQTGHAAQCFSGIMFPVTQSVSRVYEVAPVLQPMGTAAAAADSQSQPGGSPAKRRFNAIKLVSISRQFTAPASTSPAAGSIAVADSQNRPYQTKVPAKDAHIQQQFKRGQLGRLQRPFHSLDLDAPQSTAAVKITGSAVARRFEANQHDAPDNASGQQQQQQQSGSRQFHYSAASVTFQPKHSFDATVSRRFKSIDADAPAMRTGGVCQNVSRAFDDKSALNHKFARASVRGRKGSTASLDTGVSRRFEQLPFTANYNMRATIVQQTSRLFALLPLASDFQPTRKSEDSGSRTYKHLWTDAADAAEGSKAVQVHRAFHVPPVQASLKHNDVPAKRAFVPVPQLADAPQPKSAASQSTTSRQFHINEAVVAGLGTKTLDASGVNRAFVPLGSGATGDVPLKVTTVQGSRGFVSLASDDAGHSQQGPAVHNVSVSRNFEVVMVDPASLLVAESQTYQGGSRSFTKPPTIH